VACTMHHAQGIVQPTRRPRPCCSGMGSLVWLAGPTLQWADLMTLPAHTLDLVADEALVLSELAEALAHNRLDRYRRRPASLACTDLTADQRIASADLLRFTDHDEAAPIPDGVLHFDMTV